MVQKLPRQGKEREKLRQKGQFWTPEWIADAMVLYVLKNGENSIFDPAVGEGAFLKAAKKYGKLKNIEITLKGFEIDEKALNNAYNNGLSDKDLKQVVIRGHCINLVFDFPSRFPSVFVYE